MTASGQAMVGNSGRSIDQLVVDTIRTLAMDAVQAANSGHPGSPMALPPVAHTLWSRFLRFDPELPVWANRDRFVLSVGHASALLYSMLHLAGVKSVNADYETVGEPAVSLDDLERFRQLDSKCPGHAAPAPTPHRCSGSPRPCAPAPGSPAAGTPCASSRSKTFLTIASENRTGPTTRHQSSPQSRGHRSAAAARHWRRRRKRPRR